MELRVQVGCAERQDRGELHRLTFPVSGLAAPSLWFEVPRAHADMVSSSCDAALVALLAPAMAQGRALTVDGPVTDGLVWAVRQTVQPILSRTVAGLTAIPIHAPDRQRVGDAGGDAVLTGLSCGVDSLAVVAEHLLDAAPDERITHFLFNDVGSHGPGDGTPGLAEGRWQRMAAAAAALERPIIRVQSNLGAFYRGTQALHFQATHTLRNGSVALTFQAGARRFLYGSTYSWNDTWVRPTYDMAHAEPMLLPVLSTPRLELRCVGQEHTRVEKTRRIAALPIAHRHLDVCVSPGGDGAAGVNCSRCFKCLRTLLTLELLGRLGLFEGVFDLAQYRRSRTGYVARLLAGEGAELGREILDLMQESGFRPSTHQRARAAAYSLWTRVPAPVRRLAR